MSSHETHIPITTSIRDKSRASDRSIDWSYKNERAADKSSAWARVRHAHDVRSTDLCAVSDEPRGTLIK